MNKLLLISCLAMSACASISDGSRQIIKVHAMNGYKEIKAHCLASNGREPIKIAETPEFIGVDKSREPLIIDCQSHDGKLNGHKVLESDTSAKTFANILAGGIIGAAIDQGTGAAYKYPDITTVDMH